jgi:hypothetical protein
MVTSARWHPLNPDLFLTVSEDSTVRIWSVNDKAKSKMVARARSKQGKRLNITSCAFSFNGKLIAVGCEDVSARVWLCQSLLFFVHPTCCDSLFLAGRVDPVFYPFGHAAATTQTNLRRTPPRLRHHRAVFFARWRSPRVAVYGWHRQSVGRQDLQTSSAACGQRFANSIPHVRMQLFCCFLLVSVA